MACPFLESPSKDCFSVLTFENIYLAARLRGDDFTGCPEFLEKFGKLKSKCARLIKREKTPR
ncbi:MAG: hypothetical protein HY720_30245 [Planctomycetes bacterium]|nr:hypothetical protein [Planctomycetota bacterium]